MRHIEHIFKNTDNELEDWQKLLGGTIEGNTLFTSEGTIKELKFDSHRIIIVNLFLTEEATTIRTISKPITYYPIIFSENLTFKSVEEGTTQAVYTQSPSTGICFSNVNARIQYPKGKGINMILFRLPYTAFKRVLPDDHIFLKHLQNDGAYFFYESINVEMKMIMQGLQSNHLTGKLSVEMAKVCSWQLFLLFADKFFYQRQNHFKPFERQLLQKLQEVREYMLSDLSAPKDINELTRFSGMSATKLRASFKEVYGMSIYNLFQEHRMEKARELLAEGGKSVSEVAYILGYTHLGHFTGAFKQKFQCLPKDFKP